MLKVSFPHIGNSYIPLRTLLMELGLEPVIPPLTSRRTIERGTRIAPEFACYPLKVNLGNYLEVLPTGVDLIFMAGGIGPCRFGYYGELQREIIKEAGYNLEFIVLEAPKTHPMELWNKLKHYFPRHRVPDIFRATYFAWLKAEALDRFDHLANRIRPVEREPGTVDHLQKQFYQRLDHAGLSGEIINVRNNALEELKGVLIRQGIIPQKIVMLGEIFMVLEPRVNFFMEQMLGNMGVEVVRTIYFSEWVHETLLLSIIQPNWRQKYLELAKPYLANFVGGHGVETVAHTVAAVSKRYHGVIQLAPFTCMPEVIAMQAIQTVNRNLKVPVLSIIFDEHSAEAGIRTRLEAFVDLLRHRELPGTKKSKLQEERVF